MWLSCDHCRGKVQRRGENNSCGLVAELVAFYATNKVLAEELTVMQTRCVCVCRGGGACMHMCMYYFTISNWQIESPEAGARVKYKHGSKLVGDAYCWIETERRESDWDTVCSYERFHIPTLYIKVVCWNSTQKQPGVWCNCTPGVVHTCWKDTFLQMEAKTILSLFFLYGSCQSGEHL